MRPRCFTLFSFAGNLSHCLDCFQRIFTVSCFTAKHQCVCAVIDCVGNIGYFRTGRARILDHGVKHLGRNDHRLFHFHAFADQEKQDDYLLCEVQNDATLGSRKSVNVPGVRINLPSLTEKDRKNILWAIENELDFIAHSFVRNKQDVLES